MRIIFLSNVCKRKYCTCLHHNNRLATLDIEPLSAYTEKRKIKSVRKGRNHYGFVRVEGDWTVETHSPSLLTSIFFVITEFFFHSHKVPWVFFNFLYFLTFLITSRLQMIYFSFFIHLPCFLHVVYVYIPRTWYKICV